MIHVYIHTMALIAQIDVILCMHCDYSLVCLQLNIIFFGNICTFVYYWCMTKGLSNGVYWYGFKYDDVPYGLNEIWVLKWILTCEMLLVLRNRGLKFFEAIP